MSLLKVRRLSFLMFALFGLLLLGTACPKSEPGVNASSEGNLITVTEVSVPEDNQVVINGNKVIEGYPVFLSDPMRVNVDIRGAGLAPGLETSIPGKGLISKVEVQVIRNVHPEVVRVTAYVNQDVTYELKPRGNGQLLVISPKSGAAKSNQDGAEAGEGTPPVLPYNETKAEVDRLISGRPPAPVSASMMPPSTGGQPVSASASVGSLPALLPNLPAANPDGSANTVGEVYYRTMGRGVQIMIYCNGPVADFKSYESRPGSLIIELAGVKSAAPKTSYPLHWGGVNEVRLSSSGNKTRVVVSFAGRMRTYQVNKTSTGIVISVP